MDVGTVAAFLAVDLLLVCTPGADWAYAIAAGVRGRSVVPAVTGLVAGYAGHTLLAVAGLVVLVAHSAGLLTALTVAGAAYLVWLGWGVLSQPATSLATAETAGTSAGTADTDGTADPGGTVDAGGTAAARDAMGVSPRRAALKGVGISGLNPKGMLLFLAVLPQFIHPDAAFPVAAQTGLLGVLHMVCCAVVYLAVGLLARTLLASRPKAAQVVTRISGVMMIAIGVFLLVERVFA
ncbi:LysE family transporter [Streptomyces albiaxialis]|uniref:LysE family transporter n=1 Tax=Streptomyces albiaxialis TaxID=329523 RepID=A0ABN2WGD8_9ACTN